MSTITQIATKIDSQSDALKLLLVDGRSDEVSQDLTNKLTSLDVFILESCQQTKDLVNKASSFQPDALILSIKSLSNDILDELFEVKKACPLPIIIVASESAHSSIDPIVSAGVSAYLVDKVRTERLLMTIELSIARFKKEQNLICELQSTKDKLSDRKLIERAKGIIMSQKNLSEEEAYSQMRKSAMNEGQSIADLSKRVISVFEMLE